jgi:hypothetical protein
MQSSLVSQRTAVDVLERQFAILVDTLRTFTRSVPANLLYRQSPSLTVGEHILRSAGVVEQTFGGITTNLWDDPFEWTLPETLSTSSHILEYLTEVETTMSRGFASFVDDETLLKFIALPSGDSRRLLEVLIETLSRAYDYRGQAFATLKMLSTASAPGFII